MRVEAAHGRACLHKAGLPIHKGNMLSAGLDGKRVDPSGGRRPQTAFSWYQFGVLDDEPICFLLPAQHFQRHWLKVRQLRKLDEAFAIPLPRAALWIVKRRSCSPVSRESDACAYPPSCCMVHPILMTNDGAGLNQCQPGGRCGGISRRARLKIRFLPIFWITRHHFKARHNP